MAKNNDVPMDYKTAKIVLKSMASLMLLSIVKDKFDGKYDENDHVASLMDKFIIAVDIACDAMDIADDRLEIEKKDDDNKE